MGNVADAKKAYEQSLALDPDNEDAKLALARLKGTP